MSNGYNITCDPGALGMQTCYVNVNTPTGCTTGSPGCTTTKQEIIGYTQAGQPISKGQSSSSWMDFVPQLTVLNQDGQAYQPYGGAGIPYSLQGGSLVKWNPTDMQALAYLDSAPAHKRGMLTKNEFVIHFGREFSDAEKEMKPKPTKKFKAKM